MNKYVVSFFSVPLTEKIIKKTVDDYIPLVNLDNKPTRINLVSSIANNDINNFLNMKLHTYIGFNFDFTPYN